jgi:salicylate hydroxylase
MISFSANFLDALAACIDKSKIHEHFGKRCSNITATPSGRSLIHFADGSTHETDVVIGADGVKSTVRNAVIGEEASKKSLVFTNTVAYRGLVPVEKLQRLGMKTDIAPWPSCWLGQDKVGSDFILPSPMYIIGV